jgi:hypothetical protein
MDDDKAFFDFLGAREAALGAAVGYFVTDNIPTDSLREIVRSSQDSMITLAARIVLHHRQIDPERQKGGGNQPEGRFPPGLHFP